MKPSRFGNGTHHGAQGAAAFRAGRTFEEDIEATNRVYADQGLLAIARAYPPVGGPPGGMFYRGKGQVDFVGHVLGVPLALDTKSNTGQASYKHDERDDHELDFLLRWRATGGVAFLLIRDDDMLYLVDDLARLRARGTVALRTHARGRAVPMPVVPSLRRTDAERTLDAARNRPIWPWLTLAAEYSGAIASALSAHCPSSPAA
jgi:hypothetical protein